MFQIWLFLRFPGFWLSMFHFPSSFFTLLGFGLYRHPTLQVSNFLGCKLWELKIPHQTLKFSKWLRWPENIKNQVFSKIAWGGFDHSFMVKNAFQIFNWFFLLPIGCAFFLILSSSSKFKGPANWAWPHYQCLGLFIPFSDTRGQINLVPIPAYCDWIWPIDFILEMYLSVMGSDQSRHSDDSSADQVQRDLYELTMIEFGSPAISLWLISSQLLVVGNVLVGEGPDQRWFCRDFSAEWQW